MAQFGVGQSVRRSEDPRLITGRGRYTDDIAMAGQAHAVFVRSPFAHARIAALDVADARQAPGVIGAVTGADLDADGLGTVRCQAPVRNHDGSPQSLPRRPTLARTQVRHVGEAVALVVAETPDQARDAAELVQVDYAELDAVVDPAAAIGDGAPAIWPQEAPGNLAFDWRMGDAAVAESLFETADRVVSLDLINNRLIASPMEGRACLADYDAAAERFTVYVSSQGVHDLRDQLADDIFHLPADRFHVMTTDVGGGFGMKIFMYPEYVAVVYAARKFGRPVKWIADRSESFISDDHGRDNVSKAELAMAADGTFLALRVDTLANMGAYLSGYGPFVATRGGNPMLNGLYRLQSVTARVRGVYTNTQPVDAYRGAGRPEAAFIVERLVDVAARDTGRSPSELRRLNFIPPAAMPYRTATGLTYDSGDFARNLDDALRLAGWQDAPARKAAALSKGRRLGVGLATYVEACAGGSGESAVVSVNRDGRVTILIGTQSNGQGHETAYKQIVSEYLGVPPDAISVVQGDSERIARGGGTDGSRSIPTGAAAVGDAALKVQQKARLQAAELLEAAAADVEFRDGGFAVVGTDRTVTLADVASSSPDAMAFGETGHYKPPSPTYPNGAHVCEVEVDVDTGVVSVVRYTVVDDFGTVLNPSLVEGQVHGGVAQGIGQALYEHAVFDSDTGQLLSGSFMDYALPHADHLPYLTFRYNEVPCATNPLGIKGAGEAGAIGAPPAVINAVVDALSDLGVRHVDMPASSEQVWRLMQEAGSPPVAGR